MYFIKFFFFQIDPSLLFSTFIDGKFDGEKICSHAGNKFRRGIEERGGSLFRTEDRETKKLKFSAFQGQA